MNIFIDCEWNDSGNGVNNLLSMALCAEDGREFYEVLPWQHLHINGWVMENVIPILNKECVSKRKFQELLRDFLKPYVRTHIVADWPEDIAQFCNVLITGPGERLATPQLTFQIVSVFGPGAESKIPHNALEDARGIMRFCTEFNK